MVNIVTRHHSCHMNGPNYPAFNVIFLCDTGLPNTYICKEAMRVLLGDSANDVIPETLLVQLVDFPFSIEAHLSPNPSHYADVNILGMDALSQLKTITIYGKNLSFELATME